MSEKSLKNEVGIFEDVLPSGEVVRGGGLLPHEEDKHDIKAEPLMGAFFGLVPFKPKEPRKVIQTLSVKNQGNFNTCGWNTVTAQKECDEHAELSVQGLVQDALRLGYIQGDGFSALRDNQKGVQKAGIFEARFQLNNSRNWQEYSRYSQTPEMEANAETHRSQTYADGRGREFILKALQNGRSIATGMDWHNGYNMSGGFGGDFLIDDPRGGYVGGHAFLVKGYDLDFKGGEILICQNSFGSEWGLNGDFRVSMAHAVKYFYTCYVQIDMPVATARFLNEYQEKAVRIRGTSEIYLIRGDMKMRFPDATTYKVFADRTDYSEVVVLSSDYSEALRRMPEGPQIMLNKLPRWELIKDLQTPNRQKEILKYLLLEQGKK